MANTKPLIVAISGASGAIYGVTLLKVLKQLNIPSYAVISKEALLTIKYELDLSAKEVYSLASEYSFSEDIAAPIASGSYLTRGMVIAPCSVKTLSSVANCYSNNLISRAADVCLKERRRLVILFRETPLNLGHIRLMEQATLSGAIIMPPMPNFYNNPKSINDIVNSTVSKVLDLMNIENSISKRWNG